jgi:hypothetical protein
MRDQPQRWQLRYPRMVRPLASQEYYLRFPRRLPPETELDDRRLWFGARRAWAPELA